MSTPVEPIVMLLLHVQNLHDDILAIFQKPAPRVPAGVVWCVGMSVRVNQFRIGDVAHIEVSVEGNALIKVICTLNQDAIDEYECGLLADAGWDRMSA